MEQAIPKWWYWSGTIQTTSVVENTGNVDFDAHYLVRAVNILGKLRQEVSRQNVILPTTKRLVTLELDDLSPFGIYKVTQEVEVLGVTESVETTAWVVSPLIALITVGLLALEAAYLGLRKLWRLAQKKRS